MCKVVWESFECGSIAPTFTAQGRRRIRIRRQGFTPKKRQLRCRTQRWIFPGYAEISPRLASAVMRSAAR